MPVEIPENITLEDLTRLVFMTIANGEKREAERAAAEAERAAEENKWRAERAAEENKWRAELAAAEAELATAETERAAAEAERSKSTAALERQIKRVDKQLGDLHRKFGRMEEIHMVPSVIKLLNANGYDFNDRMTSRNVKIESDERVLSEIDAIINNCATTALLEVKTSPVKVKDIEHHIRRLQIYRANCERKQIPVKELIGVLAGLEFEAEAKTAAIEAGFFVVIPDGKRIKFDVPDGFKAKNYYAKDT